MVLCTVCFFDLGTPYVVVLVVNETIVTGLWILSQRRDYVGTMEESGSGRRPGSLITKALSLL